MNKIVLRSKTHKIYHLNTQPFLSCMNMHDSPKEKWFIICLFAMPFKPFSCLKTICFKYGLLIQYLSINQRSFLYFLVKKMILIFQFMSLPNGIRRIFPILDISFFFVRKSQHLTVQSNIVNYKKIIFSLVSAL